MKLRGEKVPGVLPRAFYERSTLTVARELLGKVLIVRSRPERPLEDPRAGVTAGRIVETEAYHGEDPASHCSRGSTPRCAIMFGPAGLAYVYFVYGMYEMLNFVTERPGYPGAVLIRAVEPLPGYEPAGKTNGPGRLCRAMGVKLAHKGQALSGPALYVVDDGFRLQAVGVSGRIGIRVGVSEPWRFFVDGNAFVSRR